MLSSFIGEIMVKRKIFGIAFIFLFALSFTLHAGNPIDSLKRILLSDKADTNKLLHLNKLSQEYLKICSYDTAILYANSALQLAAVISDEENSDAVKQTVKKRVAASNIIIGRAYRNQGDYPRALDCYIKVLKIDEELKNIRGIANDLGSIGIVYDNLSNYPQALECYLRALKMNEDLGNKIGIAMNLANIGNVYIEEGKYPKALDYYFKALKIDEELGDENYQGIVLGNIGAAYLKQKKYPEALDYFFKALKKTEELEDKNGIAAALSNIGSIYTSENKYKEAEDYLLRALSLDKEIGAMDGERDDENNLTILYEKTGRYQLALEHFKNEVALKDTLFNMEKEKQLTRKEMNYKFDKKEAATKAEQDKKDAMTAEGKKNQRMVIYFISGGLVLLLVLIVFIVTGYRQKIRSNNIIALKNEEIGRQKANIVGQEEERKRIAQELHDGIGGALAGTKLNLVRINSLQNIPELDSVIEYIGETCKEIRTISHNLAPPALTDNSFIDVMKEVIQKFIIPDKLKINFEYFPEEELNNIQMNIQADMYRIVQELLTNITKHAEASQVEIDISKQENELFLLVEDNGKGFEMTAARKGIGLQNIESRVKLLNGKMIIDSKIGRGTAVNINLSLADQ